MSNEAHKALWVSAASKVLAAKPELLADLLFANQSKLDKTDLLGYAKQIGLDEAKFTKDMEDPKLAKQIEEETQWAQSNGLGGTPSFLINGVTLVGAQPEDQFVAIIEKILKK